MAKRFLHGYKTYAGRIGGYIIHVDILTTGINVTYNKRVPDEIRKAVNVWLDNKLYDSIQLTQFLNKMFVAHDY